MADMTRGMEISNRLEERYSRRLEGVATERRAREAVDARRADALERERQVREDREDEKVRSARRLDTEQRQRNQQLLIDLSRSDQERQGDIDKALQGNALARPGSIYDLVV